MVGKGTVETEREFWRRTGSPRDGKGALEVERDPQKCKESRIIGNGAVDVKTEPRTWNGSLKRGGPEVVLAMER